MKTRLIISCMLLALLALMTAFMFGCASTQGEIRADIPVHDLTVVVSGPAHGHFAEESGRDLFVWFEEGSTCTGAAIGDLVLRRSHDTFAVPYGHVLCASPVRPGERVLVHAVH